MLSPPLISWAYGFTIHPTLLWKEVSIFEVESVGIPHAPLNEMSLAFVLKNVTLALRKLQFEDEEEEFTELQKPIL